MSRIRSRGNKETELALAKLFRKHGIKGWRRHQRIAVRPSSILHPRFAVRPDFVFHKMRTAVFVDGCFWHGCPRHSNLPANNRPFWRKKLGANKTRDALVNRTLKKSGWRVLRIWEHALTRRNQPRLIARILKTLNHRGTETQRRKRTSQGDLNRSKRRSRRG